MTPRAEVLAAALRQTESHLALCEVAEIRTASIGAANGLAALLGLEMTPDMYREPIGEIAAELTKRQAVARMMATRYGVVGSG